MTNTPPPVIKHQIGVRLFEPPAGAEGRQKILLLKLGERIGDFVTAIEAFRTIREGFPTAEITLICLPDIIPLAEMSGLFDRILGFAHVRGVIAQGLAPKVDIEDQEAAFDELLDGHYLLAADLRHDGSTRPWLDRVDAKYRAGFSAKTSHGLDISIPQMEWNVPYTEIDRKDLPPHATMRAFLLAQAIVASLQMRTFSVASFAAPQDIDDNQNYQTLKSEKRTKIGVSVGAGSDLRKWQTDYWIEFIKHTLQTQNALFVFFGGKGDKEETQAIMAQLPPESCLDLTATLPLAQLPTCMSLLDAYIGCDTGLTHMAAKLGLPTVNIFGGIGSPAVWAALGPKVKTVYAEVKCAPCHLRFKEECPNSNICMTAIMPGMVSACLEQLIAPEVYT